MTAQAVANVRTRQEWAEIINADWRKSIESIIQTGRDLLEARRQLPDGEFSGMVEADLPFSRRTAERLIQISQHPAITNATTSSRLPPSWPVLAELTKLSENDFVDAQEHGLINPETNARSARAVAGAYKAPDGAPVGEGKKPNMLPSPVDARKIARETGRMVAASDGNLYSGTTEDEDADYLRRREQTYGVMDAIKTIADVSVTPAEWLDQTKQHWLHKFEISDLETAVAWLEALRSEYCQREGIIDHAE